MAVSSSTVGWFESYMSNRMQQTSGGSELSDALPVILEYPKRAFWVHFSFSCTKTICPVLPINAMFPCMPTTQSYIATPQMSMILEKNHNEDLL
ncbi:Hypothetical predicted protein, partial [Paramuricea clavata]